MFFFASGGSSPLYPEICTVLHNDPARPRISVGDAEIEPVTPAPQVWRAANEPPHLNLKLLTTQCWKQSLTLKCDIGLNNFFVDARHI